MFKVMNSDELQIHVFSTYINLRYGVALLSFIFPLWLWFGGLYFGLEHQDSMSAYYHKACNDQSMRDFFVGFLFAIGGIMYLYKGYSQEENIALNLAGLCALGVALFPMTWNYKNLCEKVLIETPKEGLFSLHGIFAVSLFLCIAFVCIRCNKETLELMQDKKIKAKFNRKYIVYGVFMIVSPVLAWLFTVILQDLSSFTFYAEMFGIWIFAAYWWTKSREIAITNAEQMALKGELDCLHTK